jgi:mRNA interferase RelE/StbE
VTYQIVFGRKALQAIERDLPEKMATAALEFIAGALAENPHRVGRPLRAPLAPMCSGRRGEYRVVYRIFEARVVIEIVSIAHRRDAYRA